MERRAARRGVSTLCVDQPASGEALRLQGLRVDPHSERWAAKAMDWLERTAGYRHLALGMTGISLSCLNGRRPGSFGEINQQAVRYVPARRDVFSVEERLPER